MTLFATPRSLPLAVLFRFSLLLPLLLSAGVGWGQILTFEFSSLAGSEVSATSNSNDPNISSSTITRGAGLTASGNSGRFNATSWALTNIANAVSGNDYMEFTISPNTGFQFSVSSVLISLQRSSTGPSGIALRNSLDGYAANLDGEKAIVDNTSTQTFTFTFSQVNSTVPVTYRIYMWAESTGGSGGPGDFSGNDIVVNGAVTSAGPSTSISTSSISGSPFCVGGGSGASVDVPYTISGTYNPGNVFTAELSDASGDFTSATTIGTLTSTSAGTISATIPSGTAVGSGYRIRVVANDPATTGSDNGSDLTVQNLTAPTAAAASCGNAEGSLSWTNPACFDQVMVVVKNGTFTSALPSGDGSAYTANLAFGSGTGFDGGFVVYKGTGTASGTVTGLTNGDLHSFKVFARKGTEWVAASPDQCTPENICGSESFTSLTASGATYESGSYTGDDGVTWTYAEARSVDATYNITGRSIGFNTAGTRSASANSGSGGVGDVTFSVRSYFTGGTAADRTIRLRVNGNIKGTFTLPAMDVVYTQTITANEIGDVVISLESIGSQQIVLDDVSWTCNEALPCTTPASQPTSLNLTTVSSSAVDGSFTAASPAPYGYLVVAYPTSGSPSSNPTDGVTYALGDPLGTGLVVGVGTGTTFSATGLESGTEYSFRVYAYNDVTCTGGPAYLLTAPLSSSAFTLPQNPSGLTLTCTSNTTLTASWNLPAGNYDGVVVVVRVTTPVGTISGDPSSWTANTAYGSGTGVGSGFVVYKGVTDTFVTVTGLTPGATYHVRAAAYVGTDVWSTGTTTSGQARVPNVLTPLASPSNAQVTVTWNNIPALCFDEVMVVARQGSDVTYVPSGDGSTYSANPAFGLGTAVSTGQFVVYKGEDFSTLVTSLVNFNLYYFRIYTRFGTQWSQGVSVSATPSEATVLELGDLVMLAVNTQALSSGSDDQVCFTVFKDIAPFTAIDFTDNGYERVSAELWGDTEGTIRITRKPGSPIVPLGSVICFQGAGNTSSDFEIRTGGVTDTNWAVSSLNGTLFSFDMNVNDQIWIMQDGGWINPGGSHNAEYTGNVLYGWTAIGWEPNPGYASTAGSTIPEGLNCFTTNVDGKTDPDKVKYTGPVTDATQREWIGRVNDPENWTDYADNLAYNAALPNYWGDSLPSITVLPGDFDAGIWVGTESTNWFDCNNWQNLIVPDATTHVSVDSASNVNMVVDATDTLAVQYGGVALANDLDLSQNMLTLTGADSELRILGDLNLSGTGSLVFSGSDSTVLSLAGDWNNNLTSAAVTEGTGTVRFMGATDQTLSVAADTEEVLHQVVLDKPSSTRLILNEDLRTTATGSLSLLRGILETGSSKVSIRNPASGAITGFELLSLAIPGTYTNDRYVIGNLERQINGAGTYDFPIGQQASTGNGYNRISLSVSSGSGLVTASYLDGSPGTIDVETTTVCGATSATFDVTYTSMNEGYWRLLQGSGETIAYAATVYPNIKMGTSAPSLDDRYRLLKAPTGTEDWSEYALLGDPCTFSSSFYGGVVGAGYEGFSDFAIGGGGTPLPVDLVAFSAVNAGQQVLVSWQTATELNSAWFAVERSADGLEFAEIARVAAAGTTSEPRDYTHYDDSPLSGVSYYRLRQLDLDGTEDYSRTVAVQRASQDIAAGYLWPNPASDRVVWSGLNLNGGNYALEVLDLTGRVLVSQSVETGSGLQNLELSVAELPQGTYLVRLRGKDGIRVQPLIRL